MIDASKEDRSIEVSDADADDEGDDISTAVMVTTAAATSESPASSSGSGCAAPRWADSDRYKKTNSAEEFQANILI